MPPKPSFPFTVMKSFMAILQVAMVTSTPVLLSSMLSVPRAPLKTTGPYLSPMQCLLSGRGYAFTFIWKQQLITVLTSDFTYKYPSAKCIFSVLMPDKVSDLSSSYVQLLPSVHSAFILPPSAQSGIRTATLIFPSISITAFSVSGICDFMESLTFFSFQSRFDEIY